MVDVFEEDTQGHMALQNQKEDRGGNQEKNPRIYALHVHATSLCVRIIPFYVITVLLHACMTTR